MYPVDKTVWIDMDGTLFDFDGAALSVVPAERIVPRKHFYVAQDYPEPYKTALKTKYESPGFFANLRLFPGAINGWRSLLDAGYYPRILSSPLSGSPNCTEEKLASIEKHLVPVFGEQVLKDAVIDKEKWKYPGLALIDDRPHVVRSDIIMPWAHILYGWSHVKDIEETTASYRIKDWSQPEKLIEILGAITTSRNKGVL